MPEFSNIFLLGLILLSVPVVIFWRRKNRKFLTPEVRQKAGELIRKDGWGETQLALIIPIYFILLVGSYFLEYSFGIAKATKLIFLFFLLPCGYSILRNYKIYRKADLPQKFVNDELSLGIFILSVVALMIVFLFVD